MDSATAVSLLGALGTFIASIGGAYTIVHNARIAQRQQRREEHQEIAEREAKLRDELQELLQDERTARRAVEDALAEERRQREESERSFNKRLTETQQAMQVALTQRDDERQQRQRLEQELSLAKKRIAELEQKIAQQDEQIKRLQGARRRT